jgi:hypothetical protein
MAAAVERAEVNQRARERACFRAFFDMVSKRPWIDRIVRESEFVAPGVFREYYEQLARGYARRVRVAQLRGGRRPLRPRGHRLRVHGHRQLRGDALGRLDRGRPGPR